MVEIKYPPAICVLTSTEKCSPELPGVLAAKTLPPYAEDVGSSPGWGTKIPHAIEQPSPCATTETQHNPKQNK